MRQGKRRKQFAGKESQKSGETKNLRKRCEASHERRRARKEKWPQDEVNKVFKVWKKRNPLYTNCLREK